MEYLGEYGAVTVAERVVQLIWQRQAFAGRELKTLGGKQVRVRNRPSALPREEARIAFHPGDLKLAETGGLAATIRRVTYRGDILRVELSIGPDDQTLFMNVPAPARIEAGQRVAVTLADGWVLPDLQTEHA